MQITEVSLSEITIGSNRRPVGDISHLVQSILQVGLLNPIHLTVEKKLIAGLHRLESFRFIGRETIPAIICTGDELDAEIQEIDENLIRNELSALEQGEQLLRRDELLAARGERKASGDNRFSRGEESSPLKTTATIAAEVGLSERIVQQRKQVARDLMPDVKDVLRETNLADSKTDLLKLSRQTPETQRSVAAKLQEKTPEGKPVTSNVHHALNLIRQDDADKTARENTERKATVTLGDCLQWLQSQPQCDLLITDPPYSTDVDDIERFAATWLPLALSKVKPTGRAYVCIGAYPNELEAYLAAAHLGSHGLHCEQVLVWTYCNTLGPSPKYDYKLNWQAILYFRGEDAPGLDCPKMTEQFSVQSLNAPDGRIGDRYHAWQKPNELAERLIRHSTKPNDLVLDCFAGTGTFLLAAARLGRDARGCDQSPEILAIAAQRGCNYEN